MQYSPTADELLEVVAEVIETELLTALPDHLRHRARVSANLVRVVQRELRLGPGSSRKERDALRGLLGRSDETALLSVELAARLRTEDNQAFWRDAWITAVEIARDDLAIAKPGYDAWERD